MACNQPSFPGQSPVRTKGNPKCAMHINKDVALICNQCSEAICVTCVTTTHKEHIDSFVDLTNIVPQKKISIQDFIIKTEYETLPELFQDIQSTRQHLVDCDNLYIRLENDVILQGRLCKEEVDCVVAEYVSVCDDLKQQDRQVLEDHINEQQNRYESLVLQIKQCKLTLQTGTNIQVYDEESEINAVTVQSLDASVLHTTEFFPCEDRRVHVKSAIGTLVSPDDHQRLQLPLFESDTSSVNSNQQRPPVRPIQTPTTDQHPQRTPNQLVSKDMNPANTQDRAGSSGRRNITRICPTSEECAWICDKSHTAVLLDNHGRIRETVRHKNDIWDISIDPNTGHLWLCDKKGGTILEALPSSQSPVTRFSIDGRPHSLCVTMDGHTILVGIDSLRSSKVSAFTKEGEVLYSTTDHQSVVNYPQSIIQCPVTGNIALVSNCDSVIVLDPTLKIMHTYKGDRIQERRAKYARYKFITNSIAYDCRGYIVVSEERGPTTLVDGSGERFRQLTKNRCQIKCIGTKPGVAVWVEHETDTGNRVIKLLRYFRD